MSQSKYLWATGLLSLVICAGSVFAQDEGGPRGPRGPGRGGPPGGGFGMGGPGGGASLSQMAADEQVQKELGATEEQVGYLKLLRDESREEDREFFESLRDTPREERFEKMREYQEKRVPEIDGQLKEILGDDKLKRLKEIRLQASGPMALLSPEIAKEVGLTDDQKTKLQETVRESFGRFRGGPGGPGGRPPGAPGEGPPPGDRPPRGERGARGGGPGGPGGREQFETIRKELDTKFTAVLTDKQKERWTKLLGEPSKIDFDKLREASRGERGRGGRGGDGGRDRNRGGNPPTTDRNQGSGETS